jgi:hypothetical protein
MTRVRWAERWRVDPLVQGNAEVHVLKAGTLEDRRPGGPSVVGTFRCAYPDPQGPAGPVSARSYPVGVMASYAEIASGKRWE